MPRRRTSARTASSPIRGLRGTGAILSIPTYRPSRTATAYFAGSTTVTPGGSGTTSAGMVCQPPAARHLVPDRPVEIAQRALLRARRTARS